MSKRWINTKVEFEWDGTQYIETYTEGYWYEGELALAGPNDPPDNIAAGTGQGPNAVDVTWDASDSDDGSGTEYYELRYDLDDGMKDTTTVTGPQGTGAGSYGYSITGLTASTRYYVQVRLGANSGTGETASVWAPPEPVDANSSAGVPAAPGAPTAADVSFYDIDLSWSSVTGATAYKVYMDVGTGDPTTLIATLGNVTTYTADGLDEAENYSFRLTAGNASGYSGYGTKLSQSTKWEDEGTISLSNNLATSNYITWDVPTSDAGGDESKLYGEINDTSPDVLISTQSGTGAKNYTHTGLTAEGVYTYELRIHLAHSNGHYSAGSRVTVTNPGVAPDAPSAATISAKGTSTMTFTWSNPGGATSYKVYFGTNNPPTNILNGSVTSYTYHSATSLSMGSSPYYFRLKATNSVGDSAFSNTTTADVLPADGGIPGSFTDTPVSLASSWTNPTGTATAYLYGGTSADPTSLLTSGNITSYTNTGLTPSTNYFYRTRVQTTNHNGYYGGYSSNQSNVGRGTTSPVSAPTSLSYTANSTTGFTISWTNPTYQTRTYIEYAHAGSWRTVNPDGGNYLGDNVATWVVTNSDTFDYSGTTAFAPTQNTYHLFRLRAYQTTVYSSYTSNFAAYTLPGPVSNLTATANSDELITLSWTNPGGSGLTESFMVQWGPTTGYGSVIETATNVSTHQVSGLAGSTTYYFRVRTRTDAGDSSAVTTSAATAAGPDPVLGDVLSLGGLGQATGNANATTSSSLNTANGGGGSTVAMRDFFCGGVSSTLAGPGYVATGGGTEQLSMTFSNVGNKFISRIADRTDQFTWTTSDHTHVTVSVGDYQATITGQGLIGDTATITCVWDANYNGSHDSISSNRTATRLITVGIEL